MGCNCGGAGKKNFVWEYTNNALGIRKVYKTEVEARAAQIRNSGGTITQKPA